MRLHPLPLGVGRWALDVGRCLSLSLSVQRWTLSVRRFLLPFSVERWTLNVGRLLLLFSPTLILAQQPSPSGYGPPTSVPIERSIIARTALPLHNWIDQTQAQADAKSVGCLQCHQGVEPMHKAEHVV